ncbi:MAG: branched-chain amino acid transport system II carrier protein [Firmicutes bacterium]|nr:branched-chain amino acid transport system II carrier protein [Bacillota bacterium]
MEKKSSLGDVVVIGLARFAMFFGAGNLIFPPYLGMNAGNGWFIGFMGFFIADVGLALVAILSMIKSGDVSIEGLTGRLGKVPSTIVNVLVVLCIGPFLAIPRTAATTFEIGIQPLFPNFNSWVFGAIYFGIVLVLTIRPSSVVDIVGKYMTPILVLSLIAMIVIGIINPIGQIGVTEGYNTIKEGIVSGYQTMDVLAAVIFIIILLSTAREKGYTETKDTMSIVLKSSIFAAGALFVIYGGLTYLGATTSAGGFEGYNQTGLVVVITETLLGRYGLYMLSVIILFACLTTAIGLISSCAAYFEKLTGGKVSYAALVTIIVLFSYIVSNFGISMIISIAAPVLNVLYPVMLVMIILNFFNDKIKNMNVYRVAAVFALAVSLSEVLLGFGLPLGFVKMLPLSTYGLGWILPAVAGGLIGTFIPSPNYVGADDEETVDAA